MYSPKISIVIAVYNTADYLSRCLKSVINQTMQDIEIICIDDGSTDKSNDILKYFSSIDNRIKVIKQNNLGVSIARNTGIKYANAKYIMFLDSDDFYEENTCEEAYKQIESTNSDIVMFCSSIYKNNTKYDNFTNRIIEDNIIINYTDEYPIKDKLLLTSYVWDKIYRLDFLNKNDIQFSQNVIAAEDHVFNITLLLYGAKINLLNKILYNYRQYAQPAERCKLEIKNILCAYKHLFELEKYKNLSNEEKKIYYDYFIQKVIDAFYNYPMHYSKFIPQIKLILDYFKINLNKTELSSLNNYRILAQIYKKNHLESIFSLKNISNIHKQLCIGGIKLKFKRKNKKTTETHYIYDSNTTQAIENMIFLQEFLNHKVEENTVLLIEQNDCHGECLYSACNYFLDLGFNVDILISKGEADLLPLYKVDDSRCNIFKMNKFILREIFNNKILNQYKKIFLNSDYCYFEYPWISIDNYLKYTKVPEKNFIRQIHHLDLINKNNIIDKNLICLDPMPCIEDTNIKVVNTHFPKCTANYTKNKTTNFIVIGNIESKRKNFQLLLDSVKRLKESNIYNFKITLISRIGNLQIDESIKDFFDIKGCLNYPDMYQEIQNSDFILTLLDPENPQHDRYCTVGTSGSYLHSYGFKKPCLVPEKFINIPKFNTNNSIVYKQNNNLYDAMIKAIDMTNDKYSSLVQNLDQLEKEIYTTSLENLKTLI